MKKILNIAWKDVLITVGDPAALVLTLITPFALTLVMIFAFGGVQDNGIRDIPVVIVNQDEGEIGKAFDEMLAAEGVAELLAPTFLDNPAAARAAVDQDEYAAAVIIPAGLSNNLMPTGFDGTSANLSEPIQPNELAGWSEPRAAAVIEIYANPTRPTSASIVRAIVDEFINRTSAMFTGVQVSVFQMLQSGRLSMDSPKSAFFEVGQATVDDTQNTRLITLSGKLAEGSLDAEFDWLTYMAPSMAILFLMFAMTNGGKSILAEREAGTLPRMLTSPSRTWQVIGGKIFGIYLNGITQMVVLMVASLVFFQMRWGAINVVIPTILFIVAAATGWGMLIASLAKTPAQANAIGTAVTLVFAIGAGNFIPRFLLPPWLQTFSFISPNAWGLEAFYQIRLGATAAELLPYWLGMLAMFAVLFGASVFSFRRQYA